MASESEVQVVESSFVTPSAATPSKGLWASSLDLHSAHRGYTPTVYLYRPNDAADDASFFFDVTRLKQSLAKALVLFYPLAGRLGVDEHGTVNINCNSEGALFVVARSEHTVDDFSDMMPSGELRRKFVPRIEPNSSIILAIQVTFLKGRGTLLGAVIHHVAVDGISAFHFFQTWSAIARDGDGAAIELPCHDRTLLRARSPPAVLPDALSLFSPKQMVSFREPSGLANASNKVFTISKDQVASLKRACGGGSKFCAVTALVWQCACVARRLPPDVEARISFSANVRRAVRPPLPDRYFGNAIISLSATGVVRDIASEALECVAGRIRDATHRMDDELVRSAVDYYELHQEDDQMKKVMPETELRMVCWLALPQYDADFGWGKPWKMLRAEPAPRGYVHLMDDDRTEGGSGGIFVVVCIEDAHMEEFERLLHAKLGQLSVIDPKPKADLRVKG